MSTDDPVVRHLVVHGRVQGVFFRASTQRHAERHGLTGWVRNTPAGTVEAWLEGAQDGVEAVERWMRGGGPPAAHVKRVEVASDAPQPAGYDRFEVRH